MHTRTRILLTLPLAGILSVGLLTSNAHASVVNTADRHGDVVLSEQKGASFTFTHPHDAGDIRSITAKSNPTTINASVSMRDLFGSSTQTRRDVDKPRSTQTGVLVISDAKNTKNYAKITFDWATFSSTPTITAVSNNKDISLCANATFTYSLDQNTYGFTLPRNCVEGAGQNDVIVKAYVATTFSSTYGKSVRKYNDSVTSNVVKADNDTKVVSYPAPSPLNPPAAFPAVVNEPAVVKTSHQISDPTGDLTPKGSGPAFTSKISNDLSDITNVAVTADTKRFYAKISVKDVYKYTTQTGKSRSPLAYQYFSFNFGNDTATSKYGSVSVGYPQNRDVASIKFSAPNTTSCKDMSIKTDTKANTVYLSISRDCFPTIAQSYAKLTVGTSHTKTSPHVAGAFRSWTDTANVWVKPNSVL